MAECGSSRDPRCEHRAGSSRHRADAADVDADPDANLGLRSLVEEQIDVRAFARLVQILNNQREMTAFSAYPLFVPQFSCAHQCGASSHVGCTRCAHSAEVHWCFITSVSASLPVIAWLAQQQYQPYCTDYVCTEVGAAARAGSNPT